MQQYHDHEWGLPQSNSRALWELLMLEGFQAGLSWITDQKKAARLIGNSVKCRLESDSLDVYTLTYTSGGLMPAIKVGVREFREQIAHFLESETPVAVTRRGETLGVYVPTPRKTARSADLAELRAAADRLAEALVDLDEEHVVAEVKQARRRSRASKPTK
jgi:hypothetical protein